MLWETIQAGAPQQVPCPASTHFPRERDPHILYDQASITGSSLFPNTDHRFCRNFIIHMLYKR